LTLAEVCDISYVIQLEQLEREVAALRGQSVHLDAKSQKNLPTMGEAQDEFDAWLAEKPSAKSMTPEDLERAELRELMLGR
jgi:hypothetical protein